MSDTESPRAESESEDVRRDENPPHPPRRIEQQERIRELQHRADEIYFTATPIPADEVEMPEGQTLQCTVCHCQLIEDAYWDYDFEAYLCESCVKKYVEEVKYEAVVFADARCKITWQLEAYEPQLEFRPTPEEYEFGNRDAYTFNSYFCHFRHNCTNYDELLRKFDRDSNSGRLYYEAIYQRVEQLFDEVVEAMELQEEKDRDDLNSALDDEDYEDPSSN